MSAKQIVCANCGAKYRIPETFKGHSAKCKACGAVIDVASQLEASASEADETPADAPRRARPAGAKPAAARPARARAEAGSRRRRGAGDEDEKPTRRGSRRASAGRGRRGGGRRHAADDEEQPEKKTGVWIGGGLGVVAVVVVVLVFALGGGDEGANPEDATADAGKQEAPAAPAEPQAAKDDAPVEAAAVPDQAEAADAVPVTDPEPPKADPEQPKADPDPAPKAEPKAHKTIESRDDVYNPKTDLEPVEWPAYVTEAERTEIMSLLSDVQDGGLPGSRAKAKLEELGHKALAGIINALRKIDYFDSWETMYAYELNRLLEAMTVGINVGFKPTNLDEEIPLETVDWNAKTAKAWHRLLEKYPTPEDFERLRQTRKTRNK